MGRDQLLERGPSVPRCLLGLFLGTLLAELLQAVHLELDADRLLLGAGLQTRLGGGLLTLGGGLHRHNRVNK